MADETDNDEDIYKKEDVEKELSDDEITPSEAGFMEGFDKELDEEGQKKISKKKK